MLSKYIMTTAVALKEGVLLKWNTDSSTIKGAIKTKCKFGTYKRFLVRITLTPL